MYSAGPHYTSDKCDPARFLREVVPRLDAYSLSQIAKATGSIAPGRPARPTAIIQGAKPTKTRHPSRQSRRFKAAADRGCFAAMRTAPLCCGAAQLQCYAKHAIGDVAAGRLGSKRQRSRRAHAFGDRALNRSEARCIDCNVIAVEVCDKEIACIIKRQ